MLWLLACTADLLVDEVVVGVDVAATRWDGAPDERFGASLAASDERVWAAAPGIPALLELNPDGTTDRVDDVPAVWTGLGGAVVYAAAADGTVWVDSVVAGEDAAVGETAGSTLWAAGDVGLVGVTSSGIALPDADIAVRHVTSVAVGEERVLAVVCDPDCEGRAWDFAGSAVDIALPAGDGGAIGEWNGEAWAGDPEDDVPDGAGRVCNEHGDCIVGLTGDHLGRSIGGGYAAGTFNKWIVPGRARFVPLDGGIVLSLESGAEDQPLAAVGDGGTVWLGAPYFAEQGQPGGVVYAVQRP